MGARALSATPAGCGQPPETAPPPAAHPTEALPRSSAPPRTAPTSSSRPENPAPARGPFPAPLAAAVRPPLAPAPGAHFGSLGCLTSLSLRVLPPARWRRSLSSRPPSLPQLQGSGSAWPAACGRAALPVVAHPPLKAAAGR